MEKNILNEVPCVQIAEIQEAVYEGDHKIQTWNYQILFKNLISKHSVLSKQ